MKDWTVEDIGFQLDSIQKVKLIELFEWEGDKFWHITNFAQHQILKKDRKPQCIAKNMGTWKTVDSIWKPKEVDEVREVSKEVVGDSLKKFREQWGKKK